MHFFTKQKTQKKFFVSLVGVAIFVGVLCWGLGFQSVFAQTIPASTNQISASAVLLDGKGSPVPNGDYEVRFGIYTTDRTETDSYPSDADVASRVWEETQMVTVKNGIMNAFLGAVTPIPTTLTFEGGEYFLGIRIGTDSEMTPRRKFGTFTNAINSQFLRGRTIGVNAGDIATYGTNGKFDIQQLPTGTSGKKLLLANNKDFTGALKDIKSLLSDSHQQNTDTGTDSLTFNLGSGTTVGSNNFDLTVSSASAAPTIRYNGSLSEWQFSDDGTTFTSFGATSGVTGTGTSGQVAYWTGTSTIGSVAQISASQGGTGLDTSSSTGVPVISSGTWSIASALGVSRGGTGLSSTPANGELLIGNGSGYTLATLSTGSGLTLSNGSGSISLALDVTTTGTTATTQSNSGLELVASGLRLLGGCSDGEILKWDSGSSVWACSSDLGGATAIINVNEGVTAYTGIDTLTFDANDFSISQLGSEATVTIDYANSGIARLGQDETVTGAWDFSGNATFGTIVGGVWNGTAIGATYGGTGINTSGSTGVPYITGGTWSVDATALSVAHGGTGATSLNNLITLGTHTTGNYVASVTNGNGITGGDGGSEGATLTLSLNLLTSADGTGSTSSNSGLEFQGTSSNELSLLQGCSNNEVLSWNDSTNVWQCASVSGVGGVTGSATSGQVAYWSGTSTLSGEDQLSVSRGGTGIGSYTIGDILYASGATTFSKLADVATGNVLISGGVGVAPSWGKVALGSAVSGTLPVANGGTGATTFTSNGILYGNGTSAIQATTAGTDGQLLLGVTSGAPTFATLSGDATVTNAGVLTISANSIALTTDTTGNYVASVTNGNGITGGDGGSEGATLTLSLNLLTSADGTGSTSSNSGLEFQGTSSNELSLLQGCSNNEVLSWNDSTNVWQCASVSGVGGVTGSATSGQVAYWSGTSTLSGEDQLSVSRGGTGIGSYTIGDILYASGATTFSKLADVATGNVLISGGVGVAPSWGKVALGTHTSGNYVANASTSTLTGLTGGSGGSVGASLSLAFDYTTPLTGDPALSANNTIFGTNGLIFEGATADTFETFITLTDPTADRTITLPNVSGTIITTGNLTSITATGTIASGVWNGTAIGATYGGTGINTSGSTGVPYITGGTWSVDATALSVAHGGTGLSNFGGTNTILYTTAADTLASISAAANSILVTNGSNVPSLATDIPTAVTIGSAYIYRVGGADVSLADGGTGSSLSDPNADRILFWDDSAGAVTWLSPSSNLSISTTTLDLASSVNIDTLQLGSDGTDGSFIIYSEQGATDYTTTFQPGTQTQNITYTLPNDDGTSGQVLITDGTGALSWSSVSGAGGVTGTSTSGYVAYWDSTSSIAGEQYLSLSRGGTGTTLTDPNADRILFWDDSGSAIDWLSAGPNLSISSTTIDLASSIQLGSDGSDGVLTIYSEQGATDYTSTFQPGTQTQNITYTLPANDGDASQVLVTDGAGSLSWQSVSGVGALDGAGSANAVAYWVDSNTLTYETALALSRGGTGSSLSDPGTSDYLLFWDDSAGSVTWLSPSSNLSITTTTLDLASSVNINTLQLGTDGTDGSFIIYSEQGATDYTSTFQPGTQTQNITYTLPNDDGSNNQVLTTDGTGALSWASVSGVGGVTGTGTNNYVAYWTDTSTLAAEAQLAASRGGTGLDTSGSTGVPTISSGTWSIASSLNVANGGTGATTFTSNGILYGNGTSAIQATTAGTDGQLLLGVTSGAPTFATLSGDATVTNAGVLTISANSIALTTDTTGNYVASVTNGNGITGGDGGSEGATLTLSLNLLTSADGTGSTSSNSGLEFQGTSSNELSLLQGCSNNEVLSWNDSTNVWQCASVSGVGGVTGSATSGQVAYWSGTSTLSGEDQLSVSRGGTGIGSYTTGDLLVANGATSFTKLSDIATGNVLLSQGVGIAPQWGKVALGSAVSGTLPVANGGTGVTTFTSNGILYGNGTSAIQATTAGTDGQLLLGVTSGAPTFATLSGDATVTNAGVLTISANSIALTTDTTGNYVASVTNGNGITGGDGGSEGATLTLSLNLLTSADGTGSTSSNSGLEFQGTSSNELSLLQGCSNNEVLSWNDSTNVWQCASVSGVGGVTGSATSGQVAYWSGTSTLSGEDQLSVSRGGTGIGSYTIGDILYASGATTLSKLADVATGNVLISGGVGVAPSWGKVALGSAVSGTLPVANGGTGATSLTDLIALTTDTTGNYVQSITNGSGISGADGGSEGAALTLALGALTGDWNQTGAYDIVLNNASSELTILESAGATFYGIFDVGDLSSNDKTYTFPNATGTVALGTGASNAVAYWSGTNTLSSEAQLANTRGGTGKDSSGWTGVPYVTAGTWNVSSAVSLALGGTGSSLSDPNADRILFWDDSAGAVTWLSPSSNLSISTTTLDLASSVNINTLQLGSNGTDGSFIIYSEQGATDYTTTFQPGTQTQNITYTLPNDDGTSGQVLITDGSGVLSWTSAGSGGIGDITAIGDVASGDAFTASGTQGTSLYFYDVDGRGQLTLANLSSVRTWTLPDETGTICTTGSVCSGYQAAGSYLTTSTSFAGGDITSGTYNTLSLASSITRDTEWDTAAEINAATTDTDFAYAALSNLSSVAINTSLISDTDNTDDLGSAAIGWKDIYSRTLKLDGSTSGTITLQAAATAGTNTITLPASTGTVALTSDLHSAVTLSGSYDYITLSGQDIVRGQIDLTTDVTGTLPVGNGGTGATTLNDLIVLGTHTTGNYVASATASGGLTMTGTEGGSLGILLQPSTDALSSTTSSGSGMELLSTGLSLLQGCSNDQVLSWNEASDVWECSDKTAGTSDWTAVIGTPNFSYLTDTSAHLVVGGSTEAAGAFDFDVTTTKLNIGAAASFDTFIIAPVAKGATSHSGTLTTADLTTASRTWTLPDETGTICTTGSVCSGYQAAGSYLTTSTSFAGGDITSGTYNTLSLASSITRDTEWDTAAEINAATTDTDFAYAALSNLSSVAINASLIPDTAGTLNLGSATLPWGGIYLAGTSGTPGTNNFLITGASTSGLRTITLPDASGTVITTGNLTSITATGTIASGTWNGSVIGLSYGGTNKNITASAGAVVYSDADSFELSAVGNAGECLVSNGTSAPSWTACTTASSSPFVASTGVITKVTAGDRLALLYGDAGDVQFTIENTTNSVIPTVDAAQIDLTGGATGIVTDGVDALSIAAEFGDGTTNTNSGLHINIDPVNTPSGDETFYAINIDALAAGTSATETAISVGANWDTILDSANLDISGAGAITGATGITSSGTITFSGIANDGAEATALLLNGSNQLVYRELGSNAFTSASYATTDLSNLASVAINTSLISDTDNTDDLGSAAIAWKDIYSRTIKLDGSTSGTITLQAAATAGTNTITLPASTGTVALTSDLHSAVTLSGSYDYITLSGQDIVRGQIDLTTDVTGTLPVGNGGTGVATFGGTNTLLYTSSANTLASIATANSSFLTTNGSGVPSFAALSADTFTQYALLAGRSGGQTIIGGTGAGDDLTFQTTSNGTKGSYIFSELGSGLVLSTSGTLSVVTNTLHTQNTDTGTDGTTFTVGDGTTVFTVDTSATNDTIIIEQGTYDSILSFTQPGAADQTYTFATGGTVCTTGSVCSGYQAAGSYLTTSTSFAGGDITSGTYNTLSLASSITRDTEWDTAAEINAATTDTDFAYAALSNLSSVAINASLIPDTAGTLNLGSATLPWGGIYLAGTSGTPGTNNFLITGASTSGLRTITLPDASGTVALTSDLHSAVTLSGSYDYITLSGQDIVRGQIDLTTDVTGTLPVGNGGTGAITFTTNGILYGNGTSAIAVTAAGTDTQILSNSSGTPGWINQSSISAGTLDGIDSLSFLRSDTSDSFTSGTLSFSDGTLLDLSSIAHDDSAPQGLKLPQNTVLTNIVGGGAGYIAYDTTANTVKIFNGSSWASIGGASTTLQDAYGNDVDGSDVTISLTTADDSLIFTNPSSSGTDSAFLLQLSQQNTTAGVVALDIVQSSNGANAVNVTANSIDTETGLALTANGLTSGYGITVASSSTAFTGSIADFTLSGSNASNTGSVVAINNTGTSNANTSLYIKHYATGTNNLAFRIDDVSGDTTPFVVDGTGSVGIGTAVPTSLAELYSTGAHPILTLTAADNSAYDPQIQFRTDATPTVKFSLGVDAGDSDKFKIYAGTSGIGDTSQFTIDTTGVTTIGQLRVGQQSFEDDAGAVVWTDMNVTSASSIGTIESYVARIDGNDLLTVYAESDGSGGIQNSGIGIGTSTPTATLDVRNSTKTTGTIVNIVGSAASQTTTSLLAVTASGYTTGYTGNVASFTGVSTTGAANVVKITSANTTSGSALTIQANALTTGGTGINIAHTTSVLNGSSLLKLSSSSVDTGTSAGTLLDLSSTGSTAGTIALITNNTASFTGITQSIVANGITSGTGLAIASSSTAMTGSLQSITLSGDNASNTGNLLYLNSSGANSVAKALNVAIASTGNLSTTGGVNFTLSGAHTGTGFVLSDATATGTAMGITANSLSTGTGLSIASTSTAGGASGSSYLLNLSRSGANSNSSHTAYGIYSSVTNTGTSAVNYAGYFSSTTSGTTSTAVGGYFSASGGTTANYGLLVAAGSVGIGTTAPATALELYSSASSDNIFTLTSATATNDPLLKFRTGTTPAVQFSLGIDTSDSNTFKIDSNDGLSTSPDFKIDSTGQTTIANVVLGAQSFPEDAGIVSWVDMSVTSSSASGTVESYSAQIDSTPILTVYAESNGSGGIQNPRVGIGTTTPAYTLDVLASGTGVIARFNSSNTTGCTLATGGTISCSSDVRLKKNITTINPGLETLLALHPVEYNWKYQSDGDVKSLGFIAQEVGTYLPELVTTDDFGYLRLNTIGIVPVIAKAVQEEDAKVEDIKETLNGITLKTDTNATTLLSLQGSVDNQLALAAAQLNTTSARLSTLETVSADYEARLTANETAITGFESRLATLEETNDALLDFYNAFELGNVLAKDTDGNLDLLNGRLRAKTVRTGALEIEIVDNANPTIGTLEILPVAKDEDGDGFDDWSKLAMDDPEAVARDGKTAKVLTGAVTNLSRVFVNFVDNPGSTSWRERSRGVDGEYDGFLIHLAEPVSAPVRADWFLVEEKDGNE